jgi:hypothetical protein
MEDPQRLDTFKRMASLHRISLESIASLSDEHAVEVLRNRLNHAIYTQAEDWMVPRWVYKGKSRSLEDSDASRLETLDGDWACLGGRYCKHYALADSSGLTTAHPECGSIDIWLEDKEEILFPAMLDDDDTRLQLLSPHDQIFSWSRISAPMEFTRLIYHSVDGQGREILINEVQARNISLERTTLRFYVVLRPMSPSGFEPIQRIEYKPDKKRAFVNDILALEMSEPPTRSLMTTADNPNLRDEIATLTERNDLSYSTVRGLGTAVFVYEEEIAPAGTKSFLFVSPLERIQVDEKTPSYPANSSLRDDTVEKWFEYSETTTSACFPSPELDAAFAQAQVAVAMNIEPLFEEIKHGYIGDFAQSVAAMCRIGAAEQASKYLVSVSEKPSLLGRLNTDDILEISQAALLVYAYYHDQTYLLNIRPLLARLQHIASEALRSRTPRETAFSEDIPESETESPSDLESDEEEADDWVERLKTEMDEIREAADSETGSLKPGPDEKHDESFAVTFAEYSRFVRLTSVLAHLLTVSEKIDAIDDRDVADLLTGCRTRTNEIAAQLRGDGTPPDEPESLTLLETASLFGVDDIDQEVMKLAVESLKIVGDFIQTSGINRSHHGCVSATLELGHYYARIHDGDSVERILEAISGIFSEYQMLPDFVISTRPLEVAGQRCSAVASALLLHLLLDMVGYEDGQDLIILPGIPDEWYTISTPLTIKDLHLESGVVQIEVGISANQHQIDVRTEYLPQEIEVHVPATRAMPMVKVYGGGIAGRFEDEVSPHIRIVPLSDNIVLTFHK